MTQFEDNIDKMSDEKLCEIIVAHRYLGMMNDEAISAMQELAKRRELGSNFDFEKKIEDIYTSLPKFKINMKDVMTPSISKLLGFLK